MDKLIETAFEERMAARRAKEKEKEEAAKPPVETEEERQKKLSAAYLKRTKRTEPRAEGFRQGKGPRLVENK